MNVWTLRCDGCDMVLTIARHETSCDDPMTHGALKLASDAHLAYHGDCCTLSFSKETVAAAEKRWAADAAERVDEQQREYQAAQARAEADRARATTREASFRG